MDDDKKKRLLSEEQLYSDIRQVLGTEHGFRVLQWVLCELCHFWTGSVSRLEPTERGQFDVGRSIFNALVMADVDGAFRMFEHRRALAEAALVKEKAEE